MNLKHFLIIADRENCAFYDFYINASLISLNRCLDEKINHQMADFTVILTQDPLLNTINDFWKMVFCLDVTDIWHLITTEYGIKTDYLKLPETSEMEIKINDKPDEIIVNHVKIFLKFFFYIIIHELQSFKVIFRLSLV